VRFRRLVWDDRELVLGPNEDEEVVQAVAPRLAVGDWVSLHWEWVCDRITPTQLKALREGTRRELAAVNVASHSALATLRS
jgi:hypothetical protein